MTSRPKESSGINPYPRSDARPNQVTMSSQSEEEGCPVIEESGTVCGETRTLKIFQEFRQIYDDCLRKMESNREENLALRKLAPFRKLVEDLWEQNAMLVETVEELEQEATNTVAMLQNKLDHCSEKVNDYLEDVNSLVEVIRRFREKGVIDSRGLKFNTICDMEIHGYCTSSCNKTQEASNKGKNPDSVPMIEKSRRQENLRDSSNSMSDYNCSLTDLSGISSASDVTPSSLGSDLCEILADSAKNMRVLRLNSYKSALAKQHCDRDDSNYFCDTPSEDLSLESLLRDTRGLLEAKRTNAHNRGTLDKEIPCYSSADDCSEENEKERLNKTSDLKSGKVMLKSIPESPTEENCDKDGFDDSPFIKSRSRVPCSEFPASINIKFNVVSEPSYEQRVKGCDCACNICGGSYFAG